LFQRNPNQSERRKKIKNGRGRSIFKRKKGKLRKALNKSESKRTDQSEVTENEKDDAAESKTEDGRCKYSSGKVDGLEKCIGCGVGYRYDK
jgi:phage-related protein